MITAEEAWGLSVKARLNSFTAKANPDEVEFLTKCWELITEAANRGERHAIVPWHTGATILVIGGLRAAGYLFDTRQDSYSKWYYVVSWGPVRQHLFGG
jgi:hypothetical protein